MTSLSRRRFLSTTGTAAGVVLAGPHFLRRVSAQGAGPLRIGFPLPMVPLEPNMNVRPSPQLRSPSGVAQSTR